jgi:hypothetical protein
LREIFVPQTSELSQPNHPFGASGAFDLSPDGKTLAVEFGTREPDKRITDWVALWDIESQRLIATKEVEPDEPKQTLSFGVCRDALCLTKTKLPAPVAISWQSKNIRFSPDGRELLVLTGPSLVALSFPELKVLYAVEDRVTEENIFTQMFIEGFAMAANRLAILEQISHNSDQCCALKVILAELDTGRILGQWSRPGMSQSIALSPDGKLLALTISPWGVKKIPARENNIFLLKPESGEVVRAFNSGFAAGNAEFLGGSTTVLTVPTNNMFATKDEIKVWDASTGQLKQELCYPKYGLRGGVSASANGKLLAVAAYWLNPWDVRLDRTNPRGGTSLLLWDLSTNSLVYSSPRLGQEYNLGGLPINLSWGFLHPPILVRMSASGDRLAFGGQVISVNAVTQQSMSVR